MNLGGFIRMKRNTTDTSKKEAGVKEKENQERKMCFEGLFHGIKQRSLLSVTLQ
jgi:hypothetical protein